MKLKPMADNVLLKQHEAAWEEETSLTDAFSGKILAMENLITELEKELDGLRNQFENTFEFLEKGIYSPEAFTARNKALSEKISETTAAIDEAQTELTDLKTAKENQITMLPKIRTLLDTYETLTPAEQNRLLKEVLDHVEYHKENKGREHGLWQTPPDDFKITLFPKVSKKF